MTFHRISLVIVLLAPSFAAGGEPLVLFDFDQGLRNGGTLGGAGQLAVYAPGEEPGLDHSLWGRCLDLTAASRHGGTGGDKAGGTLLFRHAQLDDLQSFTLTLWHRQNPLVGGPNARLLTKENAWDLLPLSGGVSLALGPGDRKVTYSLGGKSPDIPAGQWRFTAVVVESQSVRAYSGGIGQPLTASTRLPRQEQAAAAAGDLVLGTLGGIRPFNGWLDQLRVYDRALDEAAVQAIFQAQVAAAQEPQSAPVYELARPAAGTHRFQFARSDIPFSTRWQTRAEAPQVMQSFHATQCLWVYGSDPAFIQQVRALGIGYQGTLNGLQGTAQATPGRAAAGDLSGRHEDLDGNKNMPQWMVTFRPPHYTGCCNHPAFREIFYRDARQLVDLGVDMLHVDDWAMNASWVLHAGVCFCEPCRQGFRRWLSQRLTPAELQELEIADVAAFDYREHLRSRGVPDAATYRARFRDLPWTPLFVDFQVESMREFFREFRQRLDEWSPDRYVPVTVNSLLDRLHPNHNLCGLGVVDGFVGESSQDAGAQTAAGYLLAAKAAEAFGVTQVVSPIPRSTARTRAAIATAYALGQTHLVPWDLYMGSDAAGIRPRYFGTREQYGDLYDFIHQQSGLLDGYEPAAEIGVLAAADQVDREALTRYCHGLARQQIPFHLLLGASRQGGLPLRPADLRAVRMVVEFSPPEAFCEQDRATIREVRESGELRFVTPAVDLAALCRLRGLDLLRVEGPEEIYAWLRVNPVTRSAVVHLVNWNLGGSERAEAYRHVTLALMTPQRWGEFASAICHQPGREPVRLEPEFHADCLRLTLPEFESWALVEIRPCPVP